MKQKREEQQHYFVENPEVESCPHLVEDTVAGVRLRLWTDRGCFSYGKIDSASRLLASTMVISDGDVVLDWGCGYGFLGIMAAKLEPSCQVTMVEVNERAADLARKNLIENRVSNAEVLHGGAPDALGEQDFDVIISNPPFSLGREVVEAMIRDAYERLRPEGNLWIVVHTRKGAKRYLKLMEEIFADASTVQITGGYRILLGTK